MEKRPPKITIASILEATFWMARRFASWVALRDEGQDEHYLMPFVLPLAFLMVGGPFVAIGALFGRRRIGLAIGALIAIVFLVVGV